MAAKSSNVEKWSSLLEEMKRCQSAEELARVHGQPAHKLQHGEIEIWHYPLGVDDGSLYTIHAAVAGDQLKQLYLHLEPTAQASAKLPWWKRLFGPKPKPGDPMRALLDDPELYDKISAATVQQRQRAAAAVARFAVERIGFENQVIAKALAQLASGSPRIPKLPRHSRTWLSNLTANTMNWSPRGNPIKPPPCSRKPELHAACGTLWPAAPPMPPTRPLMPPKTGPRSARSSWRRWART